ncbi:hypothetical protein ANTPLA_LOCUS10510 [Anthophora plagiata]
MSGSQCINSLASIKLTISAMDRSQDLTLLDFFLWGTITSIIYDIPTAPKNMKERTRTACANISEQIVRKDKDSFINHLEKCIGIDRHRLEHS